MFMILSVLVKKLPVTCVLCLVSVDGLSKPRKGSLSQSALFYMNNFYCIYSMTLRGFVDFCPLQCPKTVVAVKNK